MDFVFGLHQPNSILKAVGFYVIHFIIVLALGAVAGLLFAKSVGSGQLAGAIVAIVYSTLICIMVIYQRKLPAGYYGFLVLVIPLAILLGGILGLVVPAVLTTRGT
jgi:peptidoglycan/LPS O-acetylase OafA/YrhL